MEEGSIEASNAEQTIISDACKLDKFILQIALQKITFYAIFLWITVIAVTEAWLNLKRTSTISLTGYAFVFRMWIEVVNLTYSLDKILYLKLLRQRAFSNNGSYESVLY